MLGGDVKSFYSFCFNIPLQFLVISFIHLPVPPFCGPNTLKTACLFQRVNLPFNAFDGNSELGCQFFSGDQRVGSETNKNFIPSFPPSFPGSSLVRYLSVPENKLLYFHRLPLCTSCCG